MPPSSEQLAAAWHPNPEHANALVCSRKCPIESSCPVDKGMYGYRTFWNTCRRLASGYGPSERQALFTGTAAGSYGLTHLPTT
jgi:hypothetical protein